ncbi:MAG: N-acetyltransferase [Chloroflexota bacterium]|nr:N-acetyltransferase [Chloroflexota bacterium]MDE2948655.1 N-acetyltransferase [Chloroflexota bacterium]
MLEIRPLANRREFEDFFSFPWRHYADDANWVPPLLSMRRQLLDKAKHPAWKYMDGEYFAAWRAGEIVGTVAAFINHAHNRYHAENIGFFGLFESIDDPTVAAGLLDRAAAWVRARGAEAIRGPASFTTNEECGLLVDNFSQPVIMMPYNPPYYAPLVESAGFEKVMDMHCIYQDRATIESNNTLERLERLVKRASERSGIIVRSMKARDKSAEFERFREIYNAAWEKNWGFIPMNDEELEALVKDLGMLVEPDLAFFAEIEGEAIGFALTIPNFNEALRRAYPRPGLPEPLTMAQVAWHWKIRRLIRGVRMPLMGVKQEHRNKGVELAMLLEVMKALLPSRYDYLDSGWILESNPLVKISLSLGGQIYKTHRFYQKALGA